jgi:tRNA(Ile)-lysidine synthase
MMLYDAVETTIKEEGQLAPGQGVLVAVSGGSDSLCLMDCLRHLGYALHVAYLDHQLRPESGREAEVVRSIAAEMGVPVTVGQAAVMRGGKSLEEAARIARYRFLCGVANEHGLSNIATGHTADDQAETVLMHLLRGAGSSGLRGMLPSTSLDSWDDLPEGKGLILIRPLLRVTKDQTRQHCREVGLNPIEDPSNADQTFLRNRLRHHLLPLLEEYNPNIREVLNRLAVIMAAETEFIRDAVDAAISNLLVGEAEHALRLDKPAFRLLPLAIQRGLVRRAVRRIDPALKDLSFENTNAAIQFIQKKAASEILPLQGNVELLQVEDQIVFRAAGATLDFPEFPQLPDDHPISVPVPGELDLQKGWKLRTRIVGADEKVLQLTRSDDQAAFDCDQIAETLTLGSKQAGDRIQLLGMQGRSKLSDLMINLKIPLEARARWPVLRNGQEILWVVGLRMSNAYRIRPSTKEAVLVELIKPTGK